ncbi:hypothetical protein HYW46_03000 [Candidatus Daviesbacteria bacterium]|nr:hypothetical protein [Candidatus Daviesbacteria bacterium]
MLSKKNPEIETIKSKPEKRDILTEMFEHFGIKVVDVGSQIPKANRKRKG